MLQGQKETDVRFSSSTSVRLIAVVYDKITNMLGGTATSSNVTVSDTNMSKTLTDRSQRVFSAVVSSFGGLGLGSRGRKVVKYSLQDKNHWTEELYQVK